MGLDFNLGRKMENLDMALYYVTAPDLETARELGMKLVESKLAACVNLFPNMLSIYRWKGNVERDDEIVLIIKSRKTLAGKIIEWIESNHPYECPCVLSIPIQDGSMPYLNWLREETAMPEIENER